MGSVETQFTSKPQKQINSRMTKFRKNNAEGNWASQETTRSLWCQKVLP